MAEKTVVILRRNAVEKKVGLGRSSIYAELAKNTFPKPVKLSQRSIGWIESEIDDWIASRIEKRDRANPGGQS